MWNRDGVDTYEGVGHGFEGLVPEVRDHPPDREKRALQSCHKLAVNAMKVGVERVAEESDEFKSVQLSDEVRPRDASDHVIGEQRLLRRSEVPT